MQICHAAYSLVCTSPMAMQTVRAFQISVCVVDKIYWISRRSVSVNKMALCIAISDHRTHSYTFRRVSLLCEEFCSKDDCDSKVFVPVSECVWDSETGSPLPWDSTLFEFHTFCCDAQSCNEATKKQWDARRKITNSITYNYLRMNGARILRKILSEQEKKNFRLVVVCFDLNPDRQSHKHFGRMHSHAAAASSHGENSVF